MVVAEEELVLDSPSMVVAELVSGNLGSAVEEAQDSLSMAVVVLGNLSTVVVVEDCSL